MFFTEMWERFCYYGMRALLALYVAQHLARPDVAPHVAGFFAIKRALVAVFGPLDEEQLADQVYGLYTACAYLTPVFGGLVADRLLGQRRSVVVGAIVMALGEFMLISESLFFAGLVVLVVGNGFFKANISTQVGALYPPGDPRRDRAFNIFYVGINLGAWMSPLVCGTLGQKVGWGWGFGSAGVGLLLGLVVYLWGQRYLAPDLQMQRRLDPGRARPPPLTRTQWTKIGALVVLCALNIAFWGVYEQQGSSLQFWAEKSTELHVLRWIGSDWEMPSTWFQSVNPTFIILLTPVINALWKTQARRGTEPSSVTKMAIGCFFLAFSFVLMIGAGRIVDGGGRSNMSWLVACTFWLTVGEMYLSPVGLSLVTKIAPAGLASFLMGVWFLSIFFGNYMSGYLATFAHKMTSVAFFAMLGGLALATGAMMIALYRPLRRAFGDETSS